MTDAAEAHRAIVRRLHASPWRGVFAVTGGGSLLLSDLLTVPGASATVLEARVPYHARALADFVGAAPERAASSATARAMAVAALDRARALDAGAEHLVGFALTASLATRDAKRGTHRVHVAVQTQTSTRTWSLELARGARDRAEEEDLCRDLALTAIATLLGDADAVPIALRPDEQIEARAVEAPESWRGLLSGAIAAVAHPDSATWPGALMPGAFNPVHEGHRAMAAHASARLGVGVAFELCVRNVDKPPLDYLTIEERVAQFGAQECVWLTCAPTFVEKARCFPGVRFVVGVDTLLRIADPRYYGGDAEQRDQAITEMRELGAGFLVYGRRMNGRFLVLEDLDIPAALQALCTGVAESEFRNDVSSTALRGAGGSSGPSASAPTSAR